MSILTLESLGYSYEKSKTKVLKDVSYEFEQGKIYAIVGKSGAGKTTLLSLLSGLAKPTQGRILFDGQDISKLDKYHYRSKYVGVIFQSFNLLPHLTARENVELSMEVAGYKAENKKQHALSMLEKVELDEDLANRRILKLSGGEQQRVAIARSLSYDPQIILADEPTGNLDGETQDQIMDIFRKLADEDKQCIIVVTHSPDVAEAADVIYELDTRPRAKAKKRKSAS